MTFRSNVISDLEPNELGNYGAARAKDLAFDAVVALWRRRKAEGMKQKDLARSIGRSPGWISKRLRGPGNWTIETLGGLVEGLNGELEIRVYPAEDAPSRQPNRTAYDGYEPTHGHGAAGSLQNGSQTIGRPLSERLRTMTPKSG